MISRELRRRVALTALAVLAAAALGRAAEVPTLRLRKTATPPPIRGGLLMQDRTVAAAWYPSSPTWFGLGGKTGDRNHTEVLATYDDAALYVAFLNVDRARVSYPAGVSADVRDSDSNAIWLQTPEGRSLILTASLNTNYPVEPIQASGDVAAFDGRANRLSGWQHQGWHNQHSMQQVIRIPWTTLATTRPAPGSRWRMNLVNYNQTSTARTAATVKRTLWAPGLETQPEQWGWLTFDEPDNAGRTDVAAEATLTLRPATGFGAEVTLRPGNDADLTNRQGDAAITQSNWNDWDCTAYMNKEFLQFDLSMIPRDRVIVSATLENHLRGNYNADSTDVYLHVLRLGGLYDPRTVTMMTSPLPVENTSSRLVRAIESGSWINFDVTGAVAKAFHTGSSQVAFALAGSSGNTTNGKIWDVSWARADWYDSLRPRLRITFGKPGVSYNAPVEIGSLNSVSVATVASKNKLTNGTFRYGTLEGHSNTTYWSTPPVTLLNGVNTPLLQFAGDINTVTSNPAIRFTAPVAWQTMSQTATGLQGGRPYTLSGWLRGSAPGVKASIAVEFLDQNGQILSGPYQPNAGTGNWERVVVRSTAPAGTVTARVSVKTWASGAGVAVLVSDMQLEEGTSPTTYSETMGVYYPNAPRLDGTSVAPPPAPAAITVDNTSAQVSATAGWALSTDVAGFWSANYLHDGNAGKGTKSVRFTPNLPTTGRYEVFLRWTAKYNRASNVPVDVVSATGTSTAFVDQRTRGGEWVSLGVYDFAAGTAGSVVVRNAGTNGYVVADAVQFVKIP